jgi:hypothetical protein
MLRPYWTNDQVSKLISAVSNNGKDWNKIATIVGRTSLSCRDKYIKLSTSGALKIFLEEKKLQKTDAASNLNDESTNMAVNIDEIDKTEKKTEKTENLYVGGEDKLNSLITVLNDSIVNESVINNKNIILNSNDESRLNKRKRIENEILNIKYKKTQLTHWSEMEIFKLLNQFESIDDILNEKLHEHEWIKISKLFNGRRSERSCKLKFFGLKNDKEKLEFYWNKYLEFLQNNNNNNNINNINNDDEK